MNITGHCPVCARPYSSCICGGHRWNNYIEKNT